MRPVEFQRRIAQALIEAASPRAGETLVLAVSGGPDSMALLHTLHEYATRASAGWTLHVAHLDHGLRPSSGADARYVRAEARARGLPCTVRRMSIKRTTRSRGTLEEAARRVRYDFLARVARRTGARIVVTAHHADDQAETVLHRLVRGSGIRGLAGIPPVRPLAVDSQVRLVRPMLGIRRTDVRAYLRAVAQVFREDATNARLDRARNKLRHRVLPLLATQVHAGVCGALARLAQQARWTAEFVQQSAREALQAAIRKRSRRMIALDAADLAGRPRIVQTQVILEALRELGTGEQKVRFEHLCAAADLAKPGRGRKRVELPGWMLVERDRDVLRIARTGPRSRTTRRSASAKSQTTARASRR